MTTGVGRLVALSAALAACSATTTTHAAYPERPVSSIVGYAPGGPADTTARVFAKYLGDRLDVVVDYTNVLLIGPGNPAKSVQKLVDALV